MSKVRKESATNRLGNGGGAIRNRLPLYSNNRNLSPQFDRVNGMEFGMVIVSGRPLTLSAPLAAISSCEVIQAGVRTRVNYIGVRYLEGTRQYHSEGRHWSLCRVRVRVRVKGLL